MAASITCPECGGSITRENQNTRGWSGPHKLFGCPHCQTYFDVERSPFDYVGKVFIVLAVLQLLAVLLNLWDGQISWINIVGAVLMAAMAIYGRMRFAQMARSLRKLEPSLEGAIMPAAADPRAPTSRVPGLRRARATSR